MPTQETAIHKAQDAALQLLIWTPFIIIMQVLLINLLFYPTCNRITRDCFLIQTFWEVSDDAV